MSKKDMLKNCSNFIKHDRIRRNIMIILKVNVNQDWKKKELKF